MNYIHLCENTDPP